MKLLLDTHIILWALDDNLKLSNQARELIMDAKNDIYYSSASNVIKLVAIFLWLDSIAGV